jgi:hypothetical protein
MLKFVGAGVSCSIPQSEICRYVVKKFPPSIIGTCHKIQLVGLEHTDY